MVGIDLYTNGSPLFISLEEQLVYVIDGSICKLAANVHLSTVGQASHFHNSYPVESCDHISRLICIPFTQAINWSGTELVRI